MRKARGGVWFNSGRGLDHVRYAQKHRQSIKLEKKKEMDSSGMEVVQMEESYKAPKKYLVPVVFDKGNGNCSEEAMEQDSVTYACIIGDKEDKELEKSLNSLGLSVVYSTDSVHLSSNVPDGSNIVFIINEFKGKIFEHLLKQNYRIVGHPCVEYCVSRNIPLVDRKRPVYSCTMEGVVACLTGFRNDKDLARELCDMIHWMGGSVRNKVSSAVTHVVAKNVIGTNYKNAVSFGIDIMREEWVNEAWKNRNNLTVSATDSNLMVYKQLPFLGCHLSLFGFSSTESEHVSEIAQTNGGVMCDLADDSLTHLVIANGVDTSSLPTNVPSRTHIVKQQWFWESIQIEACADEAVYYAKERPKKRPSFHNSSSFINMDSLLEASLVSLSSPIARQVLKESGLRRQSTLATASLSTPPVPKATGGAAVAKKQDTARYHIVKELLTTENNFVKILKVIVNEFMIPLGQPSQRGGQLLTHENVKSIFGNIPDILAVHTKIMNGLEERIEDWNAMSCIGDILLGQSDELLRVYPPYINYFEVTKEALSTCDRQYPRFHAFLKCNESKPECGRQTLAELLITPVQRIPRIILLLQDLLKHTDNSHCDYSQLEEAVESLKNVMEHINEDKRKTEKQMHMFELIREIEDVPATVLSSHRTFISRHDVTELNVNTGKNSKPLSIALFVFSDSIEIAKIRSGHGFVAMKDSYKPYRHLEFLTYSNIRSLIDFTDSDDVTNGFGMLVHWPDDPQERLLAFTVTGEASVKAKLITKISQLICSNNCAESPDMFVWKASSDVLHSMSKTVSGVETGGTIRRTFTGSLKGMRKKVKRTISNRSSRKPFTPLSKNFEQLDPMDESFTECDATLNTSTLSLAPPFPPTPLRAPPTKRQALGFGHSFSTMDLSKL